MRLRGGAQQAIANKTSVLSQLLSLIETASYHRLQESGKMSREILNILFLAQIAADEATAPGKRDEPLGQDAETEGAKTHRVPARS
jgi:hypothetical protein